MFSTTMNVCVEIHLPSVLDDRETRCQFVKWNYKIHITVTSYCACPTVDVDVDVDVHLHFPYYLRRIVSLKSKIHCIDSKKEIRNIAKEHQA
jgi:hypothetical protein